MKRLENKTAIVTGGNSGIGKATAILFAKEGADLVLCARRKEALDEVAEECRKYGVQVVTVKADVSSHEDCSAVVKAAIDTFGKVDILVNNAGITRDDLLMRMKESDFDAVINTNLKGTFNTIRHLSRYLLKQRAGKIINISSVSGILGNAGQSNYAASKAGVIGLTKSVARELASRGICVNAVAPGFIATDMTGNQTDNPLLDMIPLGKMGEPEDVADAVAYLAAAKYVTGEVLRVDGGIAM